MEQQRRKSLLLVTLILLWTISKSSQHAIPSETDVGDKDLDYKDDNRNFENDGNSSNVLRMESLFKDFEEKVDPLWKCDGWYGGMKWRIPKSLDCTMPYVQEENKVVEVTLFLTDINQQTVQGYECYATKTEGWIYRNFFDARTSETKISYIEVSRDDCWSMVNNKKAPDGRPLRNKGGIVSTFEKLNIKSYWWHNSTEKITNYAIVPLKIAVLEFDKSIQTTSVLKRPCLYNESVCLTEIGILVWNSNDVKTCRLKELESTSCIYAYGKYSKRLTCPEIELSLHDIQHVKLCHHTLGASSQGIFFAQKRPFEIDDVITTPDVIRPLIRMHKKVKRHVNLQEINAQEAFLNAKLNYMYEVIANATAHAVNKIHHDVCKSNQMTLNLVRYQAETGHPTVVPRFISGDPSYRAGLAGDILSIYQCAEVRNYKFLPRTTCTREWPVEYIFKNKLLTGYMSPGSHTIYTKPTLMPEPCSEFLFDGINNLYQLTNKGAVPAQVPTIPIYGDNQMHFNFPALTFRSGSGYDISEVTDVAHTYSILREIQARNKHLDTLTAEVKEIAVEITPIRFVWKSALTVFSYLPTFAKYTIGIVAGVLTASLLGLAFIKFSVMVGTLNIFLTVINHIRSLCKRKQDHVKEKKSRRHKTSMSNADLESNVGHAHDGFESQTPSAPNIDETFYMESTVNRHKKRSLHHYPSFGK